MYQTTEMQVQVQFQKAFLSSLPSSAFFRPPAALEQVRHYQGDFLADAGRLQVELELLDFGCQRRRAWAGRLPRLRRPPRRPRLQQLDRLLQELGAQVMKPSRADAQSGARLVHRPQAGKRLYHPPEPVLGRGRASQPSQQPALAYASFACHAWLRYEYGTEGQDGPSATEMSLF
jgi:hypothetical protein